MRALVTGAGGFLGFAITQALINRGDTVRSFSRGAYPELDALGVEQHQGNLADGGAVDNAIAGCDVVFHVAGKPGAWGSQRSFYEANVLGTEHVLQACRRHRVRDLVHTSTPSVVSQGGDLEGVDESLDMPETFLAHYPATKAAAEKQVRRANCAELRTVSLRPHLVWGPRDPNLLPRLAARAERLRRIGNADKLIDTTYIDDAAHAHILAADKLNESPENVAGKAYFISSGAPIGTWTMIDRMLAAADLPPVRKRIPRGAAYALGGLFELVYRAMRLRSEPPLTRWVVTELSSAHWFDITAARRDLGYEPEVTIEEGMERLAAWWRETGGSRA